MSENNAIPQAVREAYTRLVARWDYVSPLEHIAHVGCYMVQVRSDETGCSMYLGIEPDGYTHS